MVVNNFQKISLNFCGCLLVFVPALLGLCACCSRSQISMMEFESLMLSELIELMAKTAQNKTQV